MKLGDFERVGGRTNRRFVTQVKDVSGDETFELTIAGPEALVRRVVADATIALTIDSRQSKKKLMPGLNARQADLRKTMRSIAALDKVDGLLKPTAAPAQ